jgi:hypothetical protein
VRNDTAQQRQTGQPYRRSRREAALAARWASGVWRGESLCTEDGATYTLVYEGRRGGPSGPDFRDAVLARGDGTRLYGDIELHLRVSGWRAHGHHQDPRYDGIVLHAVLSPSRQATEHTTPLANGGSAPIVVLRNPRQQAQQAATGWPCSRLGAKLGQTHLRALLAEAGIARFNERVAMYRQALAASDEATISHAVMWEPADCVLFVALAEALAYGRDRQALREAGQWLLRSGDLESLFLEGQQLPKLERQRIQGLAHLFMRWETAGPWQPLRSIIEQTTEQSGDSQRAGSALVEALRVRDGVVSPGRAAILVANVVLPFAAAWAERYHSVTLAERALAIYAALPGLPSNTITRLMTRQFGLLRLPDGAVAQLGLHHIWSSHCREKRCWECLCSTPTPGPSPVRGRGEPE